MQVVIDMIGGAFTNKDGAIFLAFAADHKFSSFGVDMIPIQVHQFRDAQATRKEQLDQGSVAQADLARKVDLFEQAFDFVVVQEGNLFASRFGEFDLVGGEAGYITLR